MPATYLLDSILGFSKDIQAIQYYKKLEQSLFNQIHRLGDQCNIFGLLELADESADALWFEGRTWSYRAAYPVYHGDMKATEDKTLRDVFAKGDLFQRSGDLVVQERSGWVQSIDRIGYTFRWRGENVSAGEVRALISDLPHVLDVIVVGKKIQGYDGQAGAAAITLDAVSEHS